MDGIIKNKGLLNRNILKITALIAMTLDHIGLQLFPQYTFLRIIGRLAFPIFAYMISEGCLYTGNRKRYLASIAIVAILCQVVYFFAMNSLYQCIFVTFTLSVILIYAFDNALKKKNLPSVLAALLLYFAVVMITEYLPRILVNTDFCVDYGFLGVMLPVVVYFSKGKFMKLLSTAVCLVLLALVSGGIQWYSLLALPLIALYNGGKGKRNLKWMFYIYYPVHLVAIYVVDMLISKI